MILVTGANGMLGKAVQEELLKNNIEFVSSDIEGDVDFICDISNYDDILNIFYHVRIDSIINCAAWTNVDAAEDEENKKFVEKINVDGVNNLCRHSMSFNCKLLHISTDYVFDGQGDKPWSEKDLPSNPVNYYGTTKLEGEKLVEQSGKFFIVRTQWTYGENGKNFVDTMINVGENHKIVKVVNDQIGSPTYVNDLAKVIVEMIQTDKYGYYHVVSSGDYVSWYEFCKEIYKQVGLNTKILPVTTKEYGLSKAKRPYNSRLDRTKYVECGFTKLPDWKKSLSKYLKGIGKI